MVLEKRGAIGHEYQMIDDSFWQKSPLSLTGVFYAVLPRDVNWLAVRINKWNQSRIKCRAKRWGIG